MVATKGETGRARGKQKYLCNMWGKRKEHPNGGGVSTVGVGTVLRLEWDARSKAKGLRQANMREYAPKTMIQLENG